MSNENEDTIISGPVEFKSIEKIRHDAEVQKFMKRRRDEKALEEHFLRIKEILERKSEPPQ